MQRLVVCALLCSDVCISSSVAMDVVHGVAVVGGADVVAGVLLWLV